MMMCKCLFVMFIVKYNLYLGILISMGNSLKKAAQKKEAEAKTKTTSSSTVKAKTNASTTNISNKNNKIEAPKSSVPPIATSTTSGPLVTSTNDQQIGDYSHFSNKLSIDDFELIKVIN